MHELPITQSLLAKVVETAAQNNLSQVEVVEIRLGNLTGFVDESIQFYWKIVAKETVAEKAKVRIKRTAGKMKCLSCGKVVWQKVERCPNCTSHRVVIMGGGELELVKIIGRD